MCLILASPSQPKLEDNLQLFKPEPRTTWEQLIAPQLVRQEEREAEEQRQRAQEAAKQAESLEQYDYAPQPIIKSQSAYNGYSYGYCTFWVASRRIIPGDWGNAKSWLYHAQSEDWSTGSWPRIGAIGWTGSGYLGHVVYVEQANGEMAYISEMNGVAGWNRVGYRWVHRTEFVWIY